MPKISVCIPTYNRAALLSFAIESALNQTETDIEIIVCDDGSTDNTPAMIATFTDSRVRYIRHARNIGKSNNMRSGFAAATGKYFIKFDDDDRLVPEFLARTSAILETHSEIDFVGTDHWIIDSQNQRDHHATELNSQRWGRTQLPEGTIENLLETVFVQQSLQVGATLFRRSALQAVGFMRPNLQNCEDNDLFVRLALQGKQAYYLNDRLMEYRYHAEQQGIHRAIPYLTDKITYLENYEFTSPKLEQIRQQRLAETKLLLGLRLINIGDTQAGRRLVWNGQAAAPLKAWAGISLSLLPNTWRDRSFQVLRQVK
jgi:glycosyltransferase involved in cell wall biosynthesis